MILAKKKYKTHNSELWAITKPFKIWQYDLEGCNHKVLIFNNQYKFCHFIDRKNLNSRQVCSAKELSRYNFSIDYHQGKANKAVDTLSHFLWKDDKKNYSSN